VEHAAAMPTMEAAQQDDEPTERNGRPKGTSARRMEKPVRWRRAAASGRNRGVAEVGNDAATSREETATSAGSPARNSSRPEEGGYWTPTTPVSFGRGGG
jgi:hypothetical protein